VTPVTWIITLPKLSGEEMADLLTALEFSAHGGIGIENSHRCLALREKLLKESVKDDS